MSVPASKNAIVRRCWLFYSAIAWTVSCGSSPDDATNGTHAR